MENIHTGAKPLKILVKSVRSSQNIRGWPAFFTSGLSQDQTRTVLSVIQQELGTFRLD